LKAIKANPVISVSLSNKEKGRLKSVSDDLFDIDPNS